jgi:hypothetical protein
MVIYSDFKIKGVVDFRRGSARFFQGNTDRLQQLTAATMSPTDQPKDMAHRVSGAGQIEGRHSGLWNAHSAQNLRDADFRESWLRS